MKSKIYEKLTVQRFASAMSLMISSGLDTEYGMKLVSELVDHQVIKERISRCLEIISEGNSFTDALSEVGIFSDMTTHMLVIGTKTGYLD